MMKVAIIGAGAVGAACAQALLQQGTCREIVLVDKDNKRARGTAMDLLYSTPLVPTVDVTSGDYEDIKDATLLIITAGQNEAQGSATDKNDAEGRLRLLDKNADIYRDIVPKAVQHAPDATIMVVTDPPDPLAELTRELAAHECVFSTGTMVDSLRFRIHLAKHLNVRASDVDALILGEHGKSEVFLWSQAMISGTPALDLLKQEAKSTKAIQSSIEKDTKEANINIIEDIGASQYGIGVISARLARAVLRDEQVIFPVASYNDSYKTTLSLPSVLGKNGVEQAHEPSMTKEEQAALDKSVETLRESVSQVM